MTRSRRRICLLSAVLSILLPTVGLTYSLAQGPAATPGAGISLNWPSLLLTFVGMLLGSGIAWGTFRERVKQYGEWLSDHERQLASLDKVYVRQDLCALKEQASLTAATTAAQEATRVATTAAAAVAQAHQDMTEIAAGVKQLLERQGG